MNYLQNDDNFFQIAKKCGMQLLAKLDVSALGWSQGQIWVKSANVYLLILDGEVCIGKIENLYGKTIFFTIWSASGAVYKQMFSEVRFL